MCEANAYILKEGKEELVLEDISILRPEPDGLYLQNIFGEQRRIKARIRETEPRRSPDHFGRIDSNVKIRILNHLYPF